MIYRLASKKFSREWRRSKKYSDKEIRWLARRRHLEVKRDHSDLIVHKPKDEQAVEARFVPIKEDSPLPDERRRLFAVIKLAAVVLLFLCQHGQWAENQLSATTCFSESEITDAGWVRADGQRVGGQRPA